MSDPILEPTHPLPAAGGSFIREADGTLTRADAVPPPEKPTKPAAKAPAKEE